MHIAKREARDALFASIVCITLLSAALVATPFVFISGAWVAGIFCALSTVVVGAVSWESLTSYVDWQAIYNAQMTKQLYPTTEQQIDEYERMLDEKIDELEGL